MARKEYEFMRILKEDHDRLVKQNKKTKVPLISCITLALDCWLGPIKRKEQKPNGTQ